MDITRVSPTVFIDAAVSMLLLFVGYSATAPDYDTGGMLHVTFHNEMLFVLSAVIAFLLFRPSELTHLAFTVTPLILIAICAYQWFSFEYSDGDPLHEYRCDDAIWLFSISSVVIFAVTQAAKFVSSSRKRRRIRQW